MVDEQPEREKFQLSTEWYKRSAEIKVTERDKQTETAKNLGPATEKPVHRAQFKLQVRPEKGVQMTLFNCDKPEE